MHLVDALERRAYSVRHRGPRVFGRRTRCPVAVPEPERFSQLRGERIEFRLGSFGPHEIVRIACVVDVALQVPRYGFRMLDAPSRRVQAPRSPCTTPPPMSSRQSPSRPGPARSTARSAKPLASRTRRVPAYAIANPSPSLAAARAFAKRRVEVHLSVRARCGRVRVRFAGRVAPPRPAPTLRAAALRRETVRRSRCSSPAGGAAARSSAPAGVVEPVTGRDDRRRPQDQCHLAERTVGDGAGQRAPVSMGIARGLVLPAVEDCFDPGDEALPPRNPEPNDSGAAGCAKPRRASVSPSARRRMHAATRCAHATIEVIVGICGLADRCPGLGGQCPVALTREVERRRLEPGQLVCERAGAESSSAAS